MDPTPAPCPLCQAVADPATGRCLCPPRPAAEGGSSHLLAKAEALFESYLAARVVHARRRAREARVAFLRDPRNRGKADALRDAEREAALLEFQLVEQTRKARQARAAVPEAVGTPAPAPVPSAEPPPPEPLAPEPPRARPEERACPRCGAAVPGAVAECRCGYSFARPEPGAEPMFLSEEELIALRRGVK